MSDNLTSDTQILNFSKGSSFTMAIKKKFACGRPIELVFLQKIHIFVPHNLVAYEKCRLGECRLRDCRLGNCLL